MFKDRRRHNAIADIDGTVVPIVFEDVRHHPREMVGRIRWQMERARAA